VAGLRPGLAGKRLAFWGGLLFLLVIALGLGGCQPAAPAVGTPEPAGAPAVMTAPVVPEGVFYVHPGVSSGKISPLVYGVNHGPWAIITEKTLPLAQEAGLTVVRYPGGNWGDENDLQTYHIDQFQQLAEALGGQASINVRLHNGSPEKAAALVRYANQEQGYGIRYWGIGNEPTLFATARGLPDYGVVQFNEEWRAIALAMKAVDPSILLIGPELHQFGADLAGTPKDPAGLDWMTEFLRTNGDLVDVVSIHRYPFPQGRGGRAATVEELSRTSAEWDRIIPYLRDVILEVTGREIPIAVTEINSHWSNATGGEASPDSFYNAIWWADVLGRLITNRVEMVNYFSLQSGPSIGGYGLFTRSDPRPTYYVYKMYQMFGDELVFSGSGLEEAGVYAALHPQGELSVLLVNLGPVEISRPLVIEGGERSLLEAWRFEKDGLLQPLDASISLDPLSLPPQSITLLKLK
jgi:hypothetical protein